MWGCLLSDCMYLLCDVFAACACSERYMGGNTTTCSGFNGIGIKYDDVCRRAPARPAQHTAPARPAQHTAPARSAQHTTPSCQTHICTVPHREPIASGTWKQMQTKCKECCRMDETESKEGKIQSGMCGSVPCHGVCVFVAQSRRMMKNRPCKHPLHITGQVRQQCEGTRHINRRQEHGVLP